MASNRYLSTNFWKDNYVAELDPIEKLLFIYLLTNHKTTISGAYEMNVREVAFDTGIDKDMVQKIIDRFQADGKMYHSRGWLIIRNWLKHQKLNPKIIIGIDKSLQLLPDEFSEFVLTDVEGNRIGIDYNRLSIGYIEPTNYTNLNSNLNLNLNINSNSNPKRAKAATENLGKRTRTVEIDGMFEYWQSEVGYQITSKTKQNREYASKLLNEYEKSEIALMIKASALASEDQYAPGVSDFIDLYRKWDKLKLWGKKKGMKQRAVAQF